MGGGQSGLLHSIEYEENEKLKGQIVSHNKEYFVKGTQD
jgi:hypothetical protein